MSTRTNSQIPHSQHGGLTIVMALVLVVVMGAATFSLSRNVVRELSMGASVVQGEKAAAAADAGLDWVIVWGQGHMIEAAQFTSAGAVSGQLLLVQGINGAMSGINTGLPITISGLTDTAMLLNNAGAATTPQSFDVELRYLGLGWGNAPLGGSGGSSDNNAASGGTKGGLATSSPVGWRVLSTGRAIPTGTTQTYQSQRELIATFPY